MQVFNLLELYLNFFLLHRGYQSVNLDSKILELLWQSHQSGVISVRS